MVRSEVGDGDCKASMLAEDTRMQVTSMDSQYLAIPKDLEDAMISGF